MNGISANTLWWHKVILSIPRQVFFSVFKHPKNIHAEPNDMRCNPLKSAKLRLQVRPVHAWGRLCDRSFAAGPSDATGAVLGAQRLVQCKRNGESNLGSLDYWGTGGLGNPVL